MRVFALTLFILTALTSCKKPLPDSVCDPAAQFAASAIASTLNCKAPDAIALDLKAYFATQNVCQQPTVTGTIGDLVCPLVGKYVMTYANSKIPATWQCDLGGVPFPVEQAIVDACKKAVTI